MNFFKKQSKYISIAVLAIFVLSTSAVYAQVLEQFITDAGILTFTESNSEEYSFEKITPRYIAYTGEKPNNTHKIKVERVDKSIALELKAIKNSKDTTNAAEEILQNSPYTSDSFTAKAELIDVNGERIIKYTDIAPGVDIIYRLREEGVEQEIILKDKTKAYDSFVFDLTQTGDLKFIASDNSIWEAKDVNMQTRYSFNKGSAIDANGLVNNDILNYIYGEETAKELLITINSPYLLSEEVVYPISVKNIFEVEEVQEEPLIPINESDSAIEDETIEPVEKSETLDEATIPDENQIKDISEASVTETFADLKKGFNDFKLSIRSNKKLNSEKDKKNEKKSKSESKRLEETYDFDNLKVTSEYISKEDPKVTTLGSQSVKQKYTVENKLDEEQEVAVTNKFVIPTDKIYWNNEEKQITDTPLELAAFEKTASVVEYAEDLGQTVDGIENFVNYMHTYTAGANFSFSDQNGEPVTYDWSDIVKANQDYVLKIYKQDNQTIVELEVTVTVAANSSTVIDPTYITSTTTNYNRRYQGSAASEMLGTYGALTIGDINGDRIDDLIIGTAFADFTAVNTGSVYIVLGKSDTQLNLSTPFLTTTNFNIRYDGAVTQDSLSYGNNIRVGDVNGDSYGDLLIGTPLGDDGANASAGFLYVIFSTLVDDVGITTGNVKSLATTTNYNIKYIGSGGNTQLTNFEGFVISDVNSDGLGDLIVTGGGLYVIFSTLLDDVGATTGNNKSLATGTNYNIRYTGITGIVTWATGDVNMDGLNDLIIGSPFNSNSTGQVFVIFSTLLDDVGATTGNLLDLGTTSTTYNIRYTGATANEALSIGNSTATTPNTTIQIGDINGDFLNDLVIATSAADNVATNAGSVYVILSALITAVGSSTGNDKQLSTTTNYNIRYDGIDATSNDLGLGGQKMLAIEDVNNDGLKDLLMGSSHFDVNGTDSGALFIVFSTLLDDIGSSTGNVKTLSTSTNYNISYVGGSASHQLGAYSNLGFYDYDLDGYKELLISAVGTSYGGSGGGSMYIVSSTLIDDVGNTTGNNITLSNVTSNFTHRFDGAANQALGFTGFFGTGTPIGIGDHNNDGVKDMFITSYLADFVTTDSGAVWAVYGKKLKDPLLGSTGNNRALNTKFTYNTRIDGDTTGNTTSGIGSAVVADVNSDGINDLILADPEADNNGTNSGSVWVIFATNNNPGHKSLSASATYNIRYDGNEAGAYLGSTIYAADLNGDGFKDLIMGSAQADTNGTDSGAAYVLFSKLIDDVGLTTGNNKPLSTSTNYNIRYDGETGSRYLSATNTLQVGDVNSDGVADLAVGSAYSTNGGANSGSVWIMFSTLIDDVGATTGNNKSLATSTNYNIRYDGATAGDLLGIYKSIVIGDVNGDALSDLLIGAYEADNTATNTGSVWVMFSTLIDDVGSTTGNNKSLGTGTNYNIRYDGHAVSAELGEGTLSDSKILITDLNYDGFKDCVIASSVGFYVLFSTLIDDVGTTTGNNKSLATGSNYNTVYTGTLNSQGNLAAGDVNSDFRDDLVIANGNNVYVIYGTLIDDVGSSTNNSKPLITATNYNILYSRPIGNEALLLVRIIDADGDSYPDLIMAAKDADYNGNSSGSVWIIANNLVDNNTTTGNSRPLSTASNYTVRYDGAAADDELGYYVYGGDYTNDGFTDLIANARFTDNNGTNSGSVYLLNGPLHNAAPITAYQSNDTTVSASSPGTEISNSIMTAVSDSENERWTLNASVAASGFNTQVFKFKTNYDYTVFTAPDFRIDWEGFGESTQTNTISLWNFNSSAWDQITSASSTTDTTANGTLSGTNYVQNNEVYARVQFPHVTGGTGGRTDRIKLSVSGGVLSSNVAPSAPTTLYVSETTLGAQTGDANPVAVGDSTPVFSALYVDSDTSDVANKYQIIVYSDSGCTASVWDSGSSGTTITNINQANRSSNIEFAGTALPLDGRTYYWKIKFWDTAGDAGTFSDCTTNFTMLGPSNQLRHGNYFFNNRAERQFSW